MLPDPNVVVQAFTKRGIQLPVDLEHSTHLKAPQGDPAPAMGHITKLEVRNGAVWGAVDWNDDGRREIESKHVKYISPAWPPSKDGKIHQLLSAGLTNNPNLTMPALNTSGGDDMAVHPDICDALDLDPDASVQDCLDAIHSLKPMGNSAFVPKADYEIVRNRVTTLETQLNGVTTAQLLGRATAAVDGAIAAGHVAPSSREYHLNTCKTEEGLAAFNAFWPKQPKLVQPSGLDTRPVPGAETNAAQGADGLTDNERAFCNKLGLTAEKFKANRVSLTDLQSPFVA
jgi:phage I-like protein